MVPPVELGETYSQELIKRLQVLQAPVPLMFNFALPGQDLINLRQHEQAHRRLSLGSMGTGLVPDMEQTGQVSCWRFRR